MPDYKKMYALLCSAASSALDLLPQTPENTVGRRVLQAALLETEEIYIRQTASKDDTNES